MHPNDGRVVSTFIVQALNNEPISVFGDGTQTRSFCYVDDMVEAFVRFMATGDEVVGPMNLGNPGEYTVAELAETVIRLSGSRSRLIFKPLPHDDPERRCPDITQARQVLGWQPQVSLEEGLSATIEYFREFLQSRRPRPSPWPAGINPPIP